MHYVAGGPGRRALVFHPTYPMLAHAAKMAGTEVNNVVLGPEYQVDPDRFTEHDLIFIANPNNPTGNLTDMDIILSALSHDSMVFLDEAYYDLSKKTVADLMPQYPNLAIGRSCSKSLLAGIRLGALIGPPILIRAFESIVTAPYNLGHIQMLIASRYHELLPYIRQTCDRIIIDRKNLDNQLKELGILTYPSVTNFILFKVDDPTGILKTLLKNGIRIRNMSKIKGLTSHLRVTVGTQEENRLFIDTIKKAI